MRGLVQTADVRPLHLTGARLPRQLQPVVVRLKAALLLKSRFLERAPRSQPLSCWIKYKNQTDDQREEPPVEIRLRSGPENNRDDRQPDQRQGVLDPAAARESRTVGALRL